MARPLRLALPGGVYHVFCRGNDRQAVFLDDDDRTLFLELVEHAVDRYSLLCHSYCLMENHYHLLVETPRANLSLAMRQLNGLYARRFNRRHGRCGHVFQAPLASFRGDLRSWSVRRAGKSSLARAPWTAPHVAFAPG